MTQKRIESATAQPTVPTILMSWLAVFRPCFTAPVWNHLLVLVGGAVLAPGKRTVTQALRVMGLADRPGFGRYHEALNRARWDARDVARRLLLHLLAVLSPSGEVVIGVDDTIERRWGGKIRARGRLDAQHLPFTDAMFDAVVCQFGVMFFPDKKQAFSEAWRVLKP